MRPTASLRRLVFSCALTVSALASAAAEAQPLIIGADISALPTIEAHGGRFSDQGQKADALALFRGAGFTCFRVRLFVHPQHEGIVTNDLDYTLALARRIKASGAQLLLDLHYSDTWADPQKQFKPAAWEKLAFPELVQAVRRYTEATLARFSAEGVSPDYVQVGNEITNGMLWPTGRVEFGVTDDAASWDRFAALLQAGIDGVRAGTAGGPAPKLLLHIESTGNVPRSLWFFRHLEERRVPYDLIGISYYPEWHGSLDGLRATLNALASTFHKPVVVAETAYPYQADEHWSGKRNLDWPLSPAGQLAFLRAVLSTVRDVPEGLGSGVFYWHPESVPVDGLRAWVGGSCALFDARGEALPALRFARSDPPPATRSPSTPAGP